MFPRRRRARHQDRSRAPRFSSGSLLPALLTGVRTGNDADAIEVARLPDGGAAIRPSYDPSVEPHLYAAAEWDAFRSRACARGEFDIEQMSLATARESPDPGDC